MSKALYHRECAICNQAMDEPGQVIGLDMREFPPANVVAHRACVQARGWSGFVMIRSGQGADELVDGPAQMALAL